MPNNRNFGPGGNMSPGNMKRNLRGEIKRKLQESQCATFHLYIYGGDIYVNAEADGLDANGNIIISGGNLEIWGAKSGSDGDFVDLDGTMTISGCTFFGGGNAGMANPNNWKNSQQSINGQNSVTANYVVNVVSGSTTIKSYTAPKNVAYLYYTSPSVDSTYKFSVSTSSGNSNNNDNDNNNSDSSNNNSDSNNNNSEKVDSTGSSDGSDNFEIYQSEGKYIEIYKLFPTIITILSLYL